MGRATDAKYNLMISKPDTVDRLWIYDIDADEQKVMQYIVFKGFFVKTDEATNISANHEVQTSNSLYFGSLAESRITYDGIDMTIGTTAVASTAKLKLRCNATDFMTLDPVNASIKIGTKAINNDGTAGVGMNFDSSNRPVLLSVLQMNAGIATKLKNISYSGAIATGLEFSAANVATFNQGVLMLSTLGVDGQITASKASAYSLQAEGPCWFKGNLRMGASFVSYGGTDAGISLNNLNAVFMTGELNVDGNIVTTAGDILIPAGDFVVDGYCSANYLSLSDGITAPGTTLGKAKIYVDTADGDLKVKFGNGFVATLAADS